MAPHAGLRFAERLDEGKIVMIFAGSGWTYLELNLWSKPLPSDEHEASLDDIVWWQR